MSTTIQQLNFNNRNPRNSNHSGVNSNKDIKFTGAINKTDVAIDKFLTSNGGQKLLKFASINPTFLNLAIATTLATTLRPATILIVPGAKKEDKEYAAAKSAISALIQLATQGLIFYPLGKAMEKAGEKAKNAPKTTKFPYEIKTPKFEAFNYLTNNGLAVFVTIAASLVMVKIVAKVMNKIMPSKKPNQTTQNEVVEKQEGGNK